jgi:hypothetical protein
MSIFALHAGEVGRCQAPRLIIPAKKLIDATGAAVKSATPPAGRCGCETGWRPTPPLSRAAVLLVKGGALVTQDFSRAALLAVVIGGPSAIRRQPPRPSATTGLHQGGTNHNQQSVKNG